MAEDYVKSPYKEGLQCKGPHCYYPQNLHQTLYVNCTYPKYNEAYDRLNPKYYSNHQPASSSLSSSSSSSSNRSDYHPSSSLSSHLSNSYSSSSSSSYGGSTPPSPRPLWTIDTSSQYSMSGPSACTTICMEVACFLARHFVHHGGDLHGKVTPEELQGVLVHGAETHRSSPYAAGHANAEDILGLPRYKDALALVDEDLLARAAREAQIDRQAMGMLPGVLQGTLDTEGRSVTGAINIMAALQANMLKQDGFCSGVYGVWTKAPETVLISLAPVTGQVVRPLLFDSHPRPDTKGSCLAEYESIKDIVLRLRNILPYTPLAGDFQGGAEMLNMWELSIIIATPNATLGPAPAYLSSVVSLSDGSTSKRTHDGDHGARSKETGPCLSCDLCEVNRIIMEELMMDLQQEQARMVAIADRWARLPIQNM
eukprot:TRINITY_DN2772_c1_g1_i1.p1 TRINITY_DN2772_c1_g1~~TRINITY_DN2772_c1_g1_i1.p1  ORF type:complete len:479 (-),score=91.71 TRINITY_DN2772_c1_g1_i1:31-1308(-)